MNLLMLNAFVIYFATLFVITLIGYNITLSSMKNKQKTDLVLGNRSLNYFLTALAAHASDMSNWLFMAFPAAIFVGGLFNFWIAIGLLFFMFLNWHFIAPKIRVATEEYNCSTISGYFEQKFNDKAGIIRIITAIMAIIFFSIYISAGLKGFGILLQSTFNIPYSIGILIGAFIVAIYPLLGGYIAVAWVDLFQGMFLLLMIVLVPILAFSKIEGWNEISQIAMQKNISLSLLPSFDFKTIFSGILLACGWGLGYFGMPQILTKFMGIQNVKEMHKSKYIGISWQIITLLAATAVGLIGIAFFKGGITNPEQIFIQMVLNLTSPFWAGLILCAILAAIVSTTASQILVLTSVLTDDLYKNIINKKATRKELSWVFRAGILLIMIFAFAVAKNEIKTVMGLVWFAWAGIGCSFGPLVITSLYSTKINKYGAIAGVLGGGISSALWTIIFKEKLFGFEIPSMVVGFLISLILIYSVSMFTNFKKEVL
ncbi:TPA: sodium/proline symporter [Candidatus Dependentiae bacterium]|nr:MAG: hypothetical protein UR14_C0009G0003 [candidate division TM6 bacterium GW2011_GWE2_31_21]KKP52556.1 MAG: hypothetical protein UR43_C0012G0025 [candidate division TM6 bacterium GW2011_GWF2_33_332]HBS48462.1 sodium/proline symporter [Candidatus Dependentiae bacterium]HBZ73311.1 sodium/proline symporter [Candidatus Dependentiae bacterium]